MKLMSWVNVVGVLVLVSGAVLVCWHWEWFVMGTVCRETGSTTARNLGLLVGGLIAIWVAIWRGVVADRQARASQDQAKTSQRGLLNERYQNGAEMLGSPVLSVRLGGIHALDHVASEHPDIFHLQVMEIFAAFVVDRTSGASESEEPRKPASTSVREGSDDTGKSTWIDIESAPAEFFGPHFAADREVGPIPELDRDVKEVMRLISGRDKKRIAVESQEAFRMNLADASLPGVIFHEADFSNFDFTKTDLRRVRGWRSRFIKAVLPGADLSAASLHGADFRNADMRRVNLSAAELVGADLRKAQLGLVDLVGQNLWRGARFPSKLVGALLNGADLSEADLGHADLRGASLAGAKMDKVNLSRSNLSGADLRAASLRDAQVERTDLSKVNLGGTGADLSGANLAGANLAGANLGNAKLAGANLTNVNVSGADFSHDWRFNHESPASGLTQGQLDQACADPNNPPKLEGVHDAETGDPLNWRGKPCSNSR